jgi:hypothetical protein
MGFPAQIILEAKALDNQQERYMRGILDLGAVPRLAVARRAGVTLCTTVMLL